jgi:hypothetical protein
MFTFNSFYTMLAISLSPPVQFHFKKQHVTYKANKLILYCLNDELPAVGAVAEDCGRASRSCSGKAKESSLVVVVVVVVTSKLRLALDEDPCNHHCVISIIFSPLV